ncbi:site-specific integrase [Pelomonas sp. KK5]|uniref:site-specific integrase n=1 Tax=Pelomonas sp. KK5 TaxID=1855730 RepID=UPI00097C462E|nr:site-specific integrase [Pelomonas sp. KK5]
MDGLFLRKGMWYARLVVPQALRELVGRTEYIASTRRRELADARVVGRELLAAWARRLYEVSHGPGRRMILEQLLAGHPALSAPGYIALAEASRLTSLEVSYLLREAAGGRLRLFARLAGQPGHVLQSDDLETISGPLETETVVPSPAQCDPSRAKTFNGVVAIRQAPQIAELLLGGQTPEVILFDLADSAASFFAPTKPLPLLAQGIELLASEVEDLRHRLASRVTPEQLQQLGQVAVQRSAQSHDHAKSRRPVSDAIDAYMRVRAIACDEEQARRVRGALQLFAELEGNPPLSDITMDRMDRFRDEVLPTVPAKENQVRLIHRTTTITESIRAVAGTDWPGISRNEQVKRLQWIAGMFAWLKDREWIERDPCSALLQESSARAERKREKGPARAARDLFTPDDLNAMFSKGEWFRTGRGSRTSRGTYRTFSPFNYWLPLLGLYTGARINELAQLSLTDIKATPSGTWYLDILNLDDEARKKKGKNLQSRRHIPVHAHLIDLGLIEWKACLEAAHYQRLFPELKHDETKGYGKAATKWFGSYLASLGWERNNRKVFHSFRGTLATVCLRRLRMTEYDTAQISGHSRSAGTLTGTYLKDEAVDYLAELIAKLNFGLPEIARFDCDEGLKAVSDALRRKDRGRGAEPD